MSVVMRQNNTRPFLDAVLQDLNGAVDLTGEVIRFVVRSSDNDVVIDQSSTGDQLIITGTTTGEVRYKWDAPDTDTPGNFLGEYETYPQGSSSEYLTYPNRGHVEILITPELST